MNIPHALKVVKENSTKINNELRVMGMYLDRDPFSIAANRLQAQVIGSVGEIRKLLNEMEASIK